MEISILFALIVNAQLSCLKVKAQIVCRHKILKLVNEFDLLLTKQLRTGHNKINYICVKYRQERNNGVKWHSIHIPHESYYGYDMKVCFCLFVYECH